MEARAVSLWSRAVRGTGYGVTQPEPGSVLVIEDDGDLASVLQRALRDEGYEVEVVADGERGLALAREREFDAIVLDVLLPDISGAEVCLRLGQHGRRPPVLMATALGSVADRVAGLDAGADDYLPKPFSLAELSARLRALRRRGHSDPMPLLEVGDLRLDPVAGRAWRGESEIILAHREAQLLEVFLRRPGIVLSRPGILAAAWRGEEVTTNVVDQYVSHLRRKVDQPFGRSDIETVHRIGYRFRSPSPGSSPSPSPLG